MSKRLILLGDTHLPRFGRRLPRPLIDGLRGADAILHAGDVTERFVLDLLAEYASVEAVAGNNDPPELAAELGFTRLLTFDGLRLGLTHGHLPPGRTTPDRAWRAFASIDPPVDAVCFGHSHIPLVERRDGTWLLNPGSPTDRRRQPLFSYIAIDVADGEMSPRLVTYPSWR